MTLNNSIRLCSIDGCSGEHRAKGYCRKHYRRWRKHGTTDLRTTGDRFWSKVNKSGDCWLWTASKFNTGYGAFSLNGSPELAHRVAWQLTIGPIPEGTSYHGMCVLHKCDVRACVRPDHLFLGTHAENVADMIKKNRQAKLYGELTSNSKLNESCVKLIRELYAGGKFTHRQLGVFFGVSHTNIGCIVSRKLWGHIA